MLLLRHHLYPHNATYQSNYIRAVLFLFLLIHVCGDLDQINNTKLDRHTNGLAFALKTMSGSPLCWIVGFSREETTRSRLAAEAAERMVDV